MSDSYVGNASFRPGPPLKTLPNALRMGMRPPILGMRPPFMRPHSFLGSNSFALPQFARFRTPPFPGPFSPDKFSGPRPQFYPANRNLQKLPIFKTHTDGQPTKKADRLDDARKHNPWMTDDLIELMKRKNKANQKWLKNKDDLELKKLARQATNIYTRERNKIKKKYLESQSDTKTVETADNCDKKTDDTIISTNRVISEAVVADYITDENHQSCNEDGSNDNICNNGDSIDSENVSANTDTNGLHISSIQNIDYEIQNQSDNLNNNDATLEQMAINKFNKLSMKSTDDGLSISVDKSVTSEA